MQRPFEKLLSLAISRQKRVLSNVVSACSPFSISPKGVPSPCAMGGRLEGRSIVLLGRSKAGTCSWSGLHLLDNELHVLLLLDGQLLDGLHFAARAGRADWGYLLARLQEVEAGARKREGSELRSGAQPAIIVPPPLPHACQTPGGREAGGGGLGERLRARAGRRLAMFRALRRRPVGRRRGAHTVKSSSGMSRFTYEFT